jgi:hypothetical protein
MWPSTARRAISRVHGNAPGEKILQKWAKELKLFGLISSNPLVPWVTTLPDDNPELLDATVRLTEEAVRLSAEYMLAGLSYLDGRISRDRFEEMIPNRSLLDGGPAEPPPAAPSFSFENERLNINGRPLEGHHLQNRGLLSSI